MYYEGMSLYVSVSAVALVQTYIWFWIAEGAVVTVGVIARHSSFFVSVK